MDLSEIKRLLDAQAQAFEDFKKANDVRIKEVETKGQASGDSLAKIAKIEGDLNKAADGLMEVQAKLNRQALSGSKDKPKSEDEVEHERVFNTYLRKGRGKDVVEKLIDLEQKTMQVSSDPDGGFFVTSDLSGRIVQKVFETSPMRSVAAQQTISTDALEGVIDNNEAGFGWVAETGARPATGTPQVGKWRIPVHEMYAMPEATQQLLDDASVNVEAWLSAKVSDKFMRAENNAFIVGNGVGKPRGFLDLTTAATADDTRAWGVLEHVVTGTSGGFGADPNGSDKLIDLVHRLKSFYRTGAVWMMSRATLGAVRKLKANAEYIWLPSMTAAQNSQLLGYPVVEAEDMPAVGANSLSIAFGNFGIGYQVVDRQGIRLLRDPFTNKPYIRMYTTRRVGGDVLNSEAIKLLKFST